MTNQISQIRTVDQKHPRFAELPEPLAVRFLPGLYARQAEHTSFSSLTPVAPIV